MRTTTNIGLTVWNLSTDAFDHTMLSGNWDLIDAIANAPANSIYQSLTLPVSSNFVGRMVLLTGVDGGFQPGTLVRYDGANWQPVNRMEIQPAIPTLGNFPGRVIILSATNGGFAAWSVIRYDGTAWNIVGGWNTVNTGAGSTNIKGLKVDSSDVYITDINRGLVLSDRTNGNFYRLFFTGGNLVFEQVT